MNNIIQIEDRVSRSRNKHEGESSASLCDRLSRTREVSQRQLPTDHDYAVPTREYQLDQSSPLPATAAADLVLEVRKRKPPHRFAAIDGVTPYQFRVAHDPTGTQKINNKYCGNPSSHLHIARHRSTRRSRHSSRSKHSGASYQVGPRKGHL